MNEKLQEATVKILTEAKIFTINDTEDRYQDINKLRINNYRVGKTGIRFDVLYSILEEDDHFYMECFVDLKNNGEISSKLYPRTTKYTIENIDRNSFVNKAIEAAVAQGYIELQDGVYVDKYNKDKDASKSEFLNMIDISNEELKNTLPGKSVQSINNKATWTVLGIFTGYNNKDYVAMKKNGMFADPNIVELEKFKKSYKVL